jgi:hypothetical protein
MISVLLFRDTADSPVSPADAARLMYGLGHQCSGCRFNFVREFPSMPPQFVAARVTPRAGSPRVSDLLGMDCASGEPTHTWPT